MLFAADKIPGSCDSAAENKRGGAQRNGDANRPDCRDESLRHSVLNSRGGWRTLGLNSHALGLHLGRFCRCTVRRSCAALLFKASFVNRTTLAL